jgi:tetratricopeptide (TPR) repeat protein
VQALDEIDKLLAIQNPSLQAHTTKADTEMKLGEARRAIETLEQAIQIDNQNQEQCDVAEEYMEEAREAERSGDEFEEVRLLEIVAEIVKDRRSFCRG